MYKKIGIVALLLVTALLYSTVLTAEEEEVNAFVGNNAKTCVACHLEQVMAWKKWPMSKSWDRLSEEEQQNEDCIRCHVTGYGEPGGWVSFEETPGLVGIQCEACHGPQSDHMKVPIQDTEAKRASANKPDPDSCLVCHTPEGNENFKEFEYKESLKALADHLYPKEEGEDEEPAEDEAEADAEEAGE
jgi:hypothetical protein